MVDAGLEIGPYMNVISNPDEVAVIGHWSVRRHLDANISRTHPKTVDRYLVVEQLF